MSLGTGWNLYKFIRKHQARSILELGFNWGVSTCYLASALARDGGKGHIVSIDLSSRVEFDPGIEGFLKELGLDHLSTVFYEHTSYNWRLRDFLRRDPRPSFDLIFLDVGHLWEPDALAFLLSEKMLKPGGHIIFDDLNWTLASSEFESAKASFQALPKDERNTPHVREIFELLVKPHPNIAETWENSAWGFARKKTEAEMALGERALIQMQQDARRIRNHARELNPKTIRR